MIIMNLHEWSIFC